MSWKKGSLIAGAIAAILGLAIERDAHAAIAHVASAVCVSTVSATETKTALCSKPTGTQDAQVLVAWAFSTANQATTSIAIAEPAGWTVIREHSLVMNATRTNSFGIYYKVAATEGDTYSWVADDDNAAAAKAIGVIVNTFSGVDVNNVLDLAYVVANHEVTTDTDLLGGTATDAPDITTVTTDAWAVTFIGGNLDNVVTLTQPTGLTLAGSNVDNARNIGAAYIDAGAAAAEVIDVWGYTETGATTTRGVLATIALRPSSLNMALYRRRRLD